MEEDDASSRVLRRGLGSCLRIVIVHVADRPLAEDLVAEAFTKTWASWQIVRGLAEPPAWVIRTAMNARVSWWRRHRLEVTLGSQDTMAATSQSLALDSSLVAALRRLPVRQREVIALRLLLDLDTSATAAMLGISGERIGPHPSSPGHRRAAPRYPRPRRSGADAVNNDHTLTAIKDRLAEVRDSLGQAHPSIPAGEIIARARRRRVRRRLIPGMTGVLALVAGAAVAVTALVQASHPASHRRGFQLTAWTVVKQPGGNIKVTIHELRDPAGVQRRLRADRGTGHGHFPSPSRTRRATRGRAPV